jgi:esterase/lipase
LQAQGILSRSILLPGHGTNPSDLLLVNHEEWIAEVAYGIESLKKQAEQIFLIGFSTGAALSLYHALESSNIAGLILIAPAIKIKAPVDALLDWHYWIKSFSQNPEWICKEHEIDYVKYRSIPYNAVRQVNALIKRIKSLYPVGKLKLPMLMIASREDETICSDTAIRFFTQFHHPHSQLLLYSSINRPYTDKRIISRGSTYSALGIKHFSHVSLPFAPHNQHYGQEGDYKYASRLNNKKVIYGAYNEAERQCLDVLRHLHVLKYKRRLLTYNPDFNFMCQQIIHFIFNT